MNEGVFSHKSAKIRSRLDEFHEPPRPPMKSAPPVSRIFKHSRRYSEGPQRVSFGEKQDGILFYTFEYFSGDFEIKIHRFKLNTLSMLLIKIV
jgi:hypothetical protein